MQKNKGYGLAIIRMALGLLFIIPGIMKLLDPSGIIGLLGGLGFPAAGFFGWILILSEIFFGAALLVGWKVKMTVWPLILILLVALLTVTIPGIGQPMGVIKVLFHILGIAGLVGIYLDGSGKCTVCKE